MQLVHLTISFIDSFLGNFFGGFDTLMMTLVTFVVMDYITGVMKAIVDHKLNSEVGFKGIFKKVLIFFIVDIAVRLDSTFTINNLRYITIIFYIVNEAISIIENSISLGLPIPNKIKGVLNSASAKEKK